MVMRNFNEMVEMRDLTSYLLVAKDLELLFALHRKVRGYGLRPVSSLNKFDCHFDQHNWLDTQFIKNIDSDSKSNSNNIIYLSCDVSRSLML
jgi:hypothetical protein